MLVKNINKKLLSKEQTSCNVNKLNTGKKNLRKGIITPKMSISYRQVFYLLVLSKENFKF